MHHPHITFIGAGNMAGCIIKGLVAQHVPAASITCTNPNEDKLEALSSLGIHTTTDNTKGCEQADVIVLAVKPYVLETVIMEIAPIIQQRKPLLISLAVGVTCESMVNWAQTNVSIIRCMPNTPALIGAGMTGLYANASATEAHKTTAESIMQAVGKTMWLNEEKAIDTIASISGSGPAYFFRVMEALSLAAMDLGFSEDQAKQLTLETTLGAAQLAMQSDASLKDLRQQVTSKGGTTEAAIKVLEEGKLDELFQKATQTACQRAEELGGSAST